MSILVGKIITNIIGNKGDDDIRFICSDGSEYQMYHSQSCCESVWLEDVIGDWSDLIGSVVLTAEEVSNEPDPGKLDEYDESYTWTFYKIGTAKGEVTLRWYGTSNGYYSESVDFYEREAPKLN